MLYLWDKERCSKKENSHNKTEFSEINALTAEMKNSVKELEDKLEEISLRLNQKEREEGKKREREKIEEK